MIKQSQKEVSIIIPGYNEEIAIGTVLDEINQLKIKNLEVIVVDDGSDDRTAVIAREKGAKVISHPYRMGNGAAVKTGIRNASGETLVMMDGDGQHSPRDIPGFLKEIGKYDMVVGARNWNSHNGFHRYLANKIYNVFASFVANHKIQDLTSGFRIIKKDIAKKILYMLPNSFSYTTTLTLILMKSGYGVKYIPIKVFPRKGKSKIMPSNDGIKFLLVIFKIATLYSPFRIFLPVSLFLFCLGIGYYIYTFIHEHRFTNMSLLLLLTSIIVFLMGLISEQIAQMRYDRREDN